MMGLIVGCVTGFLEREHLLRNQTACRNGDLSRQAVWFLDVVLYVVLSARFSQPGKPG